MCIHVSCNIDYCLIARKTCLMVSMVGARNIKAFSSGL